MIIKDLKYKPDDASGSWVIYFESDGYEHQVATATDLNTAILLSSALKLFHSLGALVDAVTTPPAVHSADVITRIDEANALRHGIFSAMRNPAP